MMRIQGLTTDPLQRMRLVLPDGSALSMDIYYVPLQIGWFLNSVTYNTFAVRGMRITTNPNILFQFMNQIPFGLACYTVDNREPTQQQDFQSGASQLFLMTAAECEAYAEVLSR